MRRRSSRSVSAAEKNGPNSIVKRADGIGVAGVAIAEARGAGADGIGAVGGGANAGGAVGAGARAGAVRDGGVIAGGMIDVDGAATSEPAARAVDRALHAATAAARRLARRLLAVVVRVIVRVRVARDLGLQIVEDDAPDLGARGLEVRLGALEHEAANLARLVDEQHAVGLAGHDRRVRHG